MSQKEVGCKAVCVWDRQQGRVSFCCFLDEIRKQPTNGTDEGIIQLCRIHTVSCAHYLDACGQTDRRTDAANSTFRLGLKGAKNKEFPSQWLISQQAPGQKIACINIAQVFSFNEGGCQNGKITDSLVFFKKKIKGSKPQIMVPKRWSLWDHYPNKK